MDAFRPSGIIIRARRVTSKTNPLMNVILKKIQLCTCRGTETSTDDVLRCLTGQVDKLVGFGCISTGRSIYTNVDMQPKPTNLSICPVEQHNMSSIEVSVPLHVHSWIFLRITFMSGLVLLVTRRALMMIPEGRNASMDGLV